MYSLNARDHFNCSPSFSHNQYHNRCGQTEGRGRKYWQLNQSNEHASNYSRIKQRQRMRRYTKNTHTKRRINRQDRLKITFPGSAYPKEISQQYTPATHREAVHCHRVLLGVFHPCLWPPKAPGSTLGEGRQNSRQPTDASTPRDVQCSKPRLDETETKSFRKTVKNRILRRCDSFAYFFVFLKVLYHITSTSSVIGPSRKFFYIARQHA